MSATVSGTEAYFKGHRGSIPSRRLGRTGLRVSSVGIGSYRLSKNNAEHRETLRQALVQGCNLIDTALGYHQGEAPSLIGEVVSELIEAAELTREEIVFVAKGGYIEEEARAAALSAVQKVGSALWHSLSPAFLAEEITRTLETLRLNQLDVFLLHHPERQLEAGLNDENYRKTLQRAFAHLEEEARMGRIQWYGISSDHLHSPSAVYHRPLSFYLDTIQAKANHFAVLEIPFNLLEPDAALDPQQNMGKPLMNEAAANDLAILANRPLNAFLHRQLVRLATLPTSPGAADEFADALEATIDLENQCPNPEKLPMEEIAWGHLLHENLERIPNASAWRAILHQQALPRLRYAQTLVGDDSKLEIWLQAHHNACSRLFRAFSLFLESRAAEESGDISANFDQLTHGVLRGETLSLRSLALYRSLPGITSVLLGMRRPAYVREALRLLPSISEATALSALAALRSRPRSGQRENLERN